MSYKSYGAVRGLPKKNNNNKKEKKKKRKKGYVEKARRILAKTV